MTLGESGVCRIVQMLYMSTISATPSGITAVNDQTKSYFVLSVP